MKKIFISALVFTMTLAMLSFSPPAKKKKFIDPANMDLSVKPGDNFYLYADGGWLKNNPVPASKTRWGSFDMLRQTSLDRLKLLCEMAAANPSRSTINQMVGDFYASAMDSAAAEKLGYTPIQGELQRLNGLTTTDQVLYELTTLRTKGLGGGLFGFRVGQDDKNVNKYIATLSQGGTTLPDRDYYLKNDSRSQNIRAEYLRYMTDMFVMTGDDATVAAKKSTGYYGIGNRFGQGTVEPHCIKGPGEDL